jgi:hypothetical protein
VSLAWHRSTGLLLGTLVLLDVAMMVYTWGYGAINAVGASYGVWRIFVLQCVAALLTWRRFKRAAWVARLAWCFLLYGIASELLGALLAFTGNSTPPAVPYMLPIVPLLSIQLFILLAPAVRRHVWKREAITTGRASNV